MDGMLTAANAAYLELVVEQYRQDPNSVDASWREWLQGPGREYLSGPAVTNGPGFTARSVFAPMPEASNGATNGHAPAAKASGAITHHRVFQLINAYRVRGHLQGRLDPLGFAPTPYHDELDPAYWGFSAADGERLYDTSALFGPSEMTLNELLAWLRETYSRTIGCEFMHIHDTRIKYWLAERFEREKNHTTFDRETQLFLYEQLHSAEAFESFLGVKYRGAKRFSLEGGEALIPMLALTIEESARRGVREVVLGMAHRGRLNVLANIMRKRQRSIFVEFDDNAPETMLGRGDVKYHLGYSRNTETRFGDTVHLSLTFNPSHLEAINPVVEGKVRAKQDRFGDVARKCGLPILIHGDAAFAGQGLVTETLQMMGLEAYHTGGTVHIVVNNQIGFTTLPQDSRSTPYTTDIAKMGQIPIFHVNGEDPEAVAHVAKLAAEFRQTFQRDVIIDMYCFRRYGHNEADEPKFTQPMMYGAIDKHPPVSKVYEQELLARGVITAAEIQEIHEREHGLLEKEFSEARANPEKERHAYTGIWENYSGGPDADTPIVPTCIDDALYERVLKGVTHIPASVTPNRKIQKIIDKRKLAIAPDAPIDWGLGETLAYGSLVLEGAPVRITGQDAIRGTFSHRHAAVFDANDGRRYFPLQNLSEDQARFECYNSHLSENAVVGFEYGYALDYPEALVIWEAQFGDFANGAQVMFDQFISASEDKWERLSAVTLLLPHGFEGQGPEHSSARLERFLQLCAEDNMQVCNLTTPAQIFHALRRQVVRKWRKPLVVMTPKSLLRHKRAVSKRKDFVEGKFHRVIPEAHFDGSAASNAKVTRAVVCSGKVYYELLERRESIEDETTAIIRLEQLYPFPEAELTAALAPYANLKTVVWCQEEPANMGARTYLHPIFTNLFEGGPKVTWIARPASASPATGSPKAHRIEQDDLLNRTFPA